MVKNACSFSNTKIVVICVYLSLSLEIAAEMVNCSEFINVAVRLKKSGDKLGRR